THRFLIDGAVLREHQEFDYHGGRLSHLDAFCHVSYNGKIYNGLDFEQVVTDDRGCDRLAISIVKDGIVTPGVLLDMPGVRLAQRRRAIEDDQQTAIGAEAATLKIREQLCT